MSGTIGSNILSHSGIIAESAAGLSWSDTIVTGSTVTVEAGKGYWINTTSNACTITLPSSAEAGDQIVIVDYARTWGTNKVTLDSNGLNFQGQDDTYTVEYTTDGQSVNLIYSDSTKGWLPLEDDVVADEPTPPPTQKAAFAYGQVGSSSNTSVKNLMNSSGVIASDVTGVGTARRGTGSTGYGVDTAIYAFGLAGADTNVSNLVNSSGVVASDTTGVGTSRSELIGVRYGTDTALFSFGTIASTKTNLVSNSGVVASDTTQVGTARTAPGAATYGGDKAAVAYGTTGDVTAVKNLISNVGVVGSDVTGVGTARNSIAGVGYGGDKGAFAYGTTGGTNYVSLKNLMSNSGVIASDVTGVGTARATLASAGYSTSA